MILCAGEALIDMLPRETEEGTVFLPVPGGAVFNTAIALGRLGAPVGMFTGLSTDLFGQRLSEALTASGVVDRSYRSDRPTTLAFVTLSNGQAEYAFYDEGTAGRMLSPANAPDTKGVTAVFLGGISLAVEPCAQAYEAIALGNRHLPLIMDPNIRPSFIPDETLFRARLDRLLTAADIVKLSDEDMDWIGVTPESVLSRGVKVVCLTEGDKGATAITADGRVSVPAVEADVVDTVGAGDTFNAGVLTGLYEAGALADLNERAPNADTLRAALELGVAAAAVTVSRAGANPPTRDEVSV
ncbi:carbohydrate kinase family protein [Jannaschia aquimarina]|uniref:KdgK_1 protein n=1 Tax=Jannaschia aquimarina TaxID=935700 RepID=A0A0D1D7C8_9RHOB|nr:carbohydrate kinase [Jannaschia aquimarina]KIT15853.1 2-dehydro-3-deoxygluconokinase [Jannaschia aquimarina]SNT10064.1 fructokinase [Jannaschia aquimarina]